MAGFLREGGLQQRVVVDELGDGAGDDGVGGDGAEGGEGVRAGGEVDAAEEEGGADGGEVAGGEAGGLEGGGGEGGEDLVEEFVGEAGERHGGRCGWFCKMLRWVVEIARDWWDMDRRWFPRAIVKNGSDSLRMAEMDDDGYGAIATYLYEEGGS